jgi:CSLREA domain-containing protein
MAERRIVTILVLTALLLRLPMSPPTSAEPRASTYVVNSDADTADANPGDGICVTVGGNCTLHAAIEEANLDGSASNGYQLPNTPRPHRGLHHH